MLSQSKVAKLAVVTLVLSLAGINLTAAQPGAKHSVPPYMNPALPIAQRVNDLVSRMTLQEKVLQMQHTAPAIPRLGIPSYDWWNEALHGVARSGYATVFPQAIGMAATWDPRLVHQEGRVIATEARAKYNQAQREGNHSIYYGLTFWTPNINIVRDPRWGRGQETYGEDPFLTSTLGVALVKGMQGNNPKYLEVVATPKHFDAYSGPEPLRHGFNAQVSPQDIEATYLPAFRATLLDAHADSTMCAYNAVNGVPSCANPLLLQTILRKDWGFHGYVTSDCGAVADIAFGHHYTSDLEHASVLAVKAGTDTTCGDEYVTLVKAVKQGLIPESDINRAVKRLFTARMRLGMFDPPKDVPFNRIPMTDVNSPTHRMLAMRAALESMVLLKNQDGILPLKRDLKSIAVIGPNAESLPAIEGNYNGTPFHPVLPIDGMLRLFGRTAKILYSQGSPYVEGFPVPVPRTVFHPEAGSSVSGLKAEYFANSNFTGKPVLTRTDPQIQFDWNAASPAPRVPMKAFSVRWTGTLTPPGPGDYTFEIRKPHCYRCNVNESIRVYLDGKLIINVHESNPEKHQGVISSSGYTRRPQEPSFHAHFTDTKPHTLLVEYSHSSPLFGAGLAFEWQPPADVLRDQAVKLARKADVVVAFVGLSPNLEGEEMPIHIDGFDGGDRTALRLPSVQEKLLHALAATGKPLVVVLLNGSALAVNWAQKHAAAILDAWYPGELGGVAIAQTLAGFNNPAGRLPETFYTSVAQLPTFSDYSMGGRTYRYFKGKPLYGFGYGLSYSTFSFSHLHLSSDRIQAGQSLSVAAEVTNTSRTGGDEVAELYIEYAPHPGGPLRALKGFSRIYLAGGETRQVSFTLNPRDLSMVTEKGERLILAGKYAVFVGGSQPINGARGVSGDFQITGQKELPR